MNIIDKYLAEINELYDKIQKIQNKCSHPEESVTKEHKSDTGNYDPSADCYWTCFYCELCQKQWTEDGSK